LEFVHSLVRIIHAAVKVHIQDNPALIVGVLLNKPARIAVRLNLFSAPQLQQFRTILANSRPTTSSRQGALRVIVMRLPETDRTAPTVITVINILLHTVQLVKYAILLSRRTTQISTRSRINELRQTRRSRTRILRLRIPAGFLRHNPIHVRTLTSRQAFHGCPCLALRISNTLNNAALNVLNSVANNVINGTCLISQAVNEFLGTRPHSVRHSPLAADLVNLRLN